MIARAYIWVYARIDAHIHASIMVERFAWNNVALDSTEQLAHYVAFSQNIQRNRAASSSCTAHVHYSLGSLFFLLSALFDTYLSFITWGTRGVSYPRLPLLCAIRIIKRFTYHSICTYFMRMRSHIYKIMLKWRDDSNNDDTARDEQRPWRTKRELFR